MASALGSIFARTYAGHTGVDPYTTAVSDVYQDLFGEGIFTGKGLYDVDAFRRRSTAACRRTRCSRTICSKACTRARRSSRTSRSSTTTRRACSRTHAAQHRWVRGDWQILQLALARRPYAPGPRAQPAARSSRAGRSSTTCAGASSGPRPWRCSSPAGSRCPDVRGCGRWRRSPPSASRCISGWPKYSPGPRGRSAWSRVLAHRRGEHPHGRGPVRAPSHVPREPGRPRWSTRSSSRSSRLAITRRRCSNGRPPSSVARPRAAEPPALLLADGREPRRRARRAGARAHQAARRPWPSRSRSSRCGRGAARSRSG